MQHFIVGGCVRDVLMGHTPKDIDHLWVGATPADMIAMGMHQVGASFPVFLDANGDEHALARIERKTGVGYNGFECEFDTSITVEQDLSRRDLTMNSMAVRVEDWDHFVKTKDDRVLVDPFHGWMDIEQRVIRHTSEAFAEDPIRVLRAARFAARYGFDIHPDTIDLMRFVVPELAYIPQERIWLEFEKGLKETRPDLMFKCLHQCGAMSETGPLAIFSHSNPAVALEGVKDLDFTTRVVFATALAHDDSVYAFHRIPTDIMHVCKAYHTQKHVVLTWATSSNEDKVRFFENLRAFNQSQLCIKVIEIVQAWYGNIDVAKDQILRDLEKAKTVDAAAIAASCAKSEIKEKIFQARVKALS